MKKFTTLFFLLFFFMLLKTNQTQAAIDESYKWYLDVTNAKELHNLGITGKGIKILVIDEGLDVSHSEFSNLTIIPDAPSKNDLLSDDYHGTAMTALIAGKTLGIAPGATIYFHKKLGEDKTEQITDFTKAIQWGIDNHVDIVSMSQAYTLTENDMVNEDVMKAHYSLQDTIRKARDSGILVLSAAGNIWQSDCYDHDYLQNNNKYEAIECTSSQNDKQYEIDTQSHNPNYSVHTSSYDPSVDSIGFPAKFPEVVAVGAVQKADSNKYDRSVNWFHDPIPTKPWRWQASATGKTLDIVAPGTNVEFAVGNHEYDLIVEGSDTNTTYAYYVEHSTSLSDGDYIDFPMGGTSSATAITAGVAALLKELNPGTDGYDLQKLLYDEANFKDLINSNGFFKEQFGNGLARVNLSRLTKDVNNWLVYDNTQGGGYGATNMFDRDEGSYNYTYFPKREFLIYKFEKPVSPFGFKIIYSNPDESHNIRVTLYDKNMKWLESKDISKQGFHYFNEPHDDVEYYKIENIDEDLGIKLNEFELYGEGYPLENTIKKVNQNITLQENSKFFFENFIIPHWKTDLAGNTLHATNGYDWNDRDQQFNKVIGSNADLDINQYSTSLEWYERNSIYENDLTSKIYGQVVKDTTGYMGNWLFDDNWNNLAILNPNQPIVYEFNFPVSISQLYFGLSYKTINNQVQVKLTTETGEEQTLHLTDKDLFDRIIDLGMTYENIKKIEIMNENPSQEIKIYEVGAHGTPNEKVGNAPVTIKHSLTIYPGDFKLYEEPNGSQVQTYQISNVRTLEVTQVYGYNGAKRKFMWAKVNVDSEEKWIYTDTDKVEFMPLYFDGAIDSTPGQITDAQNDYNFYYAMDDSSTKDSMGTSGYVEYTFDTPVSGKNLFIELNEMLDNNENQMKITLFDDSNQPIYVKDITRSDLYNRIIPLGTTYTDIKKFRIENTGTNEISIANFEIKE